MMKKPSAEEFNAAGSCMIPDLARIAIAVARRAAIEPRACHWRVAPEQQAMIENSVMGAPSRIIETSVSEEEAAAALLRTSFDVTLCGLALIADPTMRDDVVELRYGAEPIARIVALSVPAVFR